MLIAFLIDNNSSIKNLFKMTLKLLCDKYEFGRKALYRELKRLLNEDSLKEARNKK